MNLQTTTVWELCTTGITFFRQCGYGRYFKLPFFFRIVHHRCHICMAYPLCGYGHGPSNDHCVRIVHHLRHICQLYHLCGYGHGPSKLPLRENCAPQVCHMCMVFLCVDTDMTLQTTTVWELFNTDITFMRPSPSHLACSHAASAKRRTTSSCTKSSIPAQCHVSYNWQGLWCVHWINGSFLAYPRRQ